MAVLVIGGSGRGAGKTAVGCALIEAMPELRWVAVKVSPHRHGQTDGLWEETDLRSEKDTVRYLRVGARRAFLVQGEDGDRLTDLVRAVREQAAECDGLLVESNRVSSGRVARAEEAALTLSVVDGKWDKHSLGEAVARADAVVVAAGLGGEGLSEKLHDGRRFVLPRGEWVSEKLEAFVRRGLMGGPV